MEKTINSIIEIEKHAQEIVNEAEKKRDSLQTEVLTEIAQLRENSLKQADEKIKSYDAEVTATHQKKIDELEKSYADRIEKLNQLSSMHFKSWVDTIYKGIIDRNASV